MGQRSERGSGACEAKASANRASATARQTARLTACGLARRHRYSQVAEFVSATAKRTLLIKMTSVRKSVADTESHTLVVAPLRAYGKVSRLKLNRIACRLGAYGKVSRLFHVAEKTELIAGNENTTRWPKIRA